MSKLLYIAANSKPEDSSVSKSVARRFINEYLALNPEDTLEELDLYSSNIPLLNYKLFTHRASLAANQDYETLSEEEKQQVNRINELCDQFLSADKYIIAAPMWSVFFPSILKTYLDCIIINGKTISVTPEKVTGLLDDKERKMVYIQSSGGIYPPIISNKFNHGYTYLHDIFKFLGISSFKKILIEGVDMPSIGREAAIKDAEVDMAHILKRF